MCRDNDPRWRLSVVSTDADQASVAVLGVHPPLHRRMLPPHEIGKTVAVTFAFGRQGLFETRAPIQKITPMNKSAILVAPLQHVFLL